MRVRWSIAAVGLLALCACGGGGPADDHEPADARLATDSGAQGADGPVGPAAFPIDLPAGFPMPIVPADNPLTREKIELGRHLFYDVRLSANGTQSCASCHDQARAFTDGRARAVGSTGQAHPRNSMSLANVAYASTLTWANPNLLTLETQAAVPLFGIDPIIELGLRGHEDLAIEHLQAEPRYPPLFAAAFPGDPQPLTMANVQRALASFERALISGRSPFDRYRYGGDKNALSAEQKRGLDLFGSETLECFHCHSGFNFTDSVSHSGLPPEPSFHNTGLYNIDGKGGFPVESRGLIDFTGKPDDMGKFKAPTLRNVAKTAPYMHDGSIATLEGVLEHYVAGGRTISSGPTAGVGSANPYKSGFISGFVISEADKRAVIAFLESLTDEVFLSDPTLSNPWISSPQADAGAPP
jgi:cytochrome c peroxidase